MTEDEPIANHGHAFFAEDCQENLTGGAPTQISGNNFKNRTILSRIMSPLQILFRRSYVYVIFLLVDLKLSFSP
jgi:hypothetical protein